MHTKNGISQWAVHYNNGEKLSTLWHKKIPYLLCVALNKRLKQSFDHW